MDFNRLTEKMQQALQAAQSKAVRLSHQQIDVEHLLTALIEQENGLAPSLLIKAGIAPDQVHRRDRAGTRPHAKGFLAHRRDGPGVRNRQTQQAVHGGGRRSQKLKDDYVSVEHVLLAMTDDSGTTGRVLKEFGSTANA